MQPFLAMDPTGEHLAFVVQDNAKMTQDGEGVSMKEDHPRQQQVKQWVNMKETMRVVTR